MIYADLVDIVDSFVRRTIDTLYTKNSGYNDSASDVLASFKKAAAMERSTPKLALRGMLTKHLVSIYDLTEQENVSEDIWDEKIGDAINYLILLRLLVEDEKSKTPISDIANES